MYINRYGYRQNIYILKNKIRLTLRLDQNQYINTDYKKKYLNYVDT